MGQVGNGVKEAAVGVVGKRQYVGLNQVPPLYRLVPPCLNPLGISLRYG